MAARCFLFDRKEAGLYNESAGSRILRKGGSILKQNSNFLQSPGVLALFDLDGTLIDSQAMVFETFRRVFHEMMPEYQLSQEELYSFFGPTLEETFARYFPQEQIGAVIDRYQVINKDLHATMLKEMPHAKETLQALREQGIVMGIVSNKRREPVLLGMKICGLTDYFDAVFAREDQPACKPEPDGLLYAAKAMGFEGCPVVYVGDNAADMQAAKRAGFLAIGYTLDETQKESLRKEGADVQIDDLRELEDLLRRLNAHGRKTN